ncbi:site-2 protease family protein [bacterium]|nr:site-2 protease family protein [bacterium]
MRVLLNFFHRLFHKISRHFNRLKQRPVFHLILLVLTIGTTWMAQGPWYSLAIITILFAHEMGHYLACRFHHIPATLPFFIPLPPPLNPFGTMGAVIRIQGQIPHRKALFDIGVAGPLAGMFFTVIALVIGLHLPTQTVATEGVPLGMSLLFRGLAYLINPVVLTEANVAIHPVAFAGWVGLFVTSLNLLPVGQLDGGHAIYAMWPEKSGFIYRVFIFLFAVNAAFYPPWVVFLILLLFFGLKHPPPTESKTPLNWARRLIGWLTITIFLLAYMPFPFDIF